MTDYVCRVGRLWYVRDGRPSHSLGSEYDSELHFKTALIEGNSQTFQAYYQEVELPHESSSNM